MKHEQSDGDAGLPGKIARLVEERGWNQEDFARASQLNRQTVRQILLASGPRRLHNATVGACARALGLTVNELRHAPLPQLLARINPPALPAAVNPAASVPASPERLYEEATQPELQAWLERNPERARQLTSEDIDELLSLQGTGGPLTSIGVEHYVGLIERKHRLLGQVQVVASTEYLDLLEKLVALLYENVQPYREKRTGHRE